MVPLGVQPQLFGGRFRSVCLSFTSSGCGSIPVGGVLKHQGPSDALELYHFTQEPSLLWT